MTYGGSRSHWPGCENVHFDCKIAMLEKRIEKLEARAVEREKNIKVLWDALDTRQAVYDRLLRDYEELKKAKTTVNE